MGIWGERVSSQGQAENFNTLQVEEKTHTGKGFVEVLVSGVSIQVGFKLHEKNKETAHSWLRCW